METNYTDLQTLDSFYNLKQDGIFEAAAAIIDGAGYSETHYFPHSGQKVEDDVVAERLWNGTEYITHGQYRIAAAIDEEYCQCSMQIPQISSSSGSMHYELNANTVPAQSTLSGNTSAFIKYTKDATMGLQFMCSASVIIKQKSLKRCFDFLRRMHKNSRARSSFEVDDSLVKDSYALTHKIAERNRRSKLSQQFLALRSLLPHNSKKVDKVSILSKAIMELNHLKLRIGELEQRNQTLMNSLTRNISTQGYDNLRHGYVADSGRDCICEEVVVMSEESNNIPDEAIMQITLKRIETNCSHLDAIVAVVEILRELNMDAIKIQCGEIESTKQVIEVTIRRKTKGQGRWEINERKQFEEAVKRALK